MGDDLKPCPWCGAAAEFIHGNVRRYARCSDAEANEGLCGVGYRTDDDWNRRPAEDALRARAEAAEARAAQVEADARVLLGMVYGIGVDMGLAIVDDLYDLGITVVESAFCDKLTEDPAVDDPVALLAIVQRVAAGAA